MCQVKSAYVITDEARVEGLVEFMTHDEYLAALDELEDHGLFFIDIRRIDM